MKRLLTWLFTATKLLALTLSAQAQTAGTPTNYTGPRFPGGPDSLRALVYRATRLAAPGAVGRVLLHFELKGNQQPYNFKLVPSPGSLNLALLEASANAMAYLEAKMPAWQPDIPWTGNKNAADEPRIALVLDFATPQAAQPYVYADTDPVFTHQDLGQYVQSRLIYPPAAMRREQQGKVYVYFEVTETGAIEHLETIGTAGPLLDAEALRVVQKLAVATAPSLLQNRPVRVFYILPLNFRLTFTRG